MNYFSITNEVNRWHLLGKKEQEKLIDTAINVKFQPICGISSIFNKLISKIDNKQYALQLFTSFVSNGYSKDFSRPYSVIGMVEPSLKLLSEDDIKNIVVKFAKNDRAYLILFMLSNLSVKEESLALKALSLYKKPPMYLYKRNFMPTYNALGALPIVTRLKVIRCLTSNKNIGYDIFAKISKEDMESLLFSISLKYNDAVKKIWNDFRYFKKMGTNSKFKINYNCDICKEYSICIESRKIQTVGDFSYTKNARALIWKVCMFCGHNVNVSIRKVKQT